MVKVMIRLILLQPPDPTAYSNIWKPALVVQEKLSIWISFLQPQIPRGEQNWWERIVTSLL